MAEAEGLCDRIGIFVDGNLHCIGHPQVSALPGPEANELYLTAEVKYNQLGVRSLQYASSAHAASLHV